MSAIKELNKKQLEKVNGGDIENGSEHLTQQEQLEKQIKALTDLLNSGNTSVEESMRLMNQITELMRELEGLKSDPGTIVNNKDKAVWFGQ